MRLNFDTLQDYLGETCRVRRFGPRSREVFFSRPLLYEGGGEMAAGGLYVARSETLPKRQPPEGVGVVCTGQRLPQVWTSGTQVLCVPGESGVLSLFNRVQEIYNCLDAWDEGLRDELERDEDFDLGRLLVLGAAQLQNPMNVVGQNLQTIFTTESQPDGDGVFHLTSGTLPPSVSADYAEEIRKVCRLERTITVPYLTSLPLPDQQSYCNNLYPFGRFMGCISISSLNRPFREGDFPLADHFFRCFQKGFLKYLRNTRPEISPSTAALGRLLNQEPLSVQEQELFQLPPGSYWRCLKLKERPGEKALPRDYMYGTVSALMSPRVLLTLCRGELAGLVQVSERESLEGLGELLDRTGYVCGLSSRFQDIRRFPDYLLQAGCAVENACRQPDAALSFFQDQILQYMLDECAGKLPVESLFSPGLLSLLEHDRARGTEYVKTLDIYLKNETSMSRTAAALYIHRSSLLKRLNKIERLIQEDLQDPDVRLYYRICFALRENRGGGTD